MSALMSILILSMLKRIYNLIPGCADLGRFMLGTVLLAAVFGAATASAQSTINSSNRFAYGANIGWVDGRADGTNGMVIGEYVCSGYIYAADVGWIKVGSGVPANGIQYQNNSAS